MEDYDLRQDLSAEARCFHKYLSQFVSVWMNTIVYEDIKKRARNKNT